jgi:hypothetical protein
MRAIYKRKGTAYLCTTSVVPCRSAPTCCGRRLDLLIGLSLHSGIRTNWLRRRFVLEGTGLSYFDDDGVQKGCIDILTAVSIRNSTCESAKGHEIEIETPPRTTMCSSDFVYYCCDRWPRN